MWSRGGAARLFFLISRWLRLRDSQAAFFQIEDISSPVNAIPHETCGPDERRNEISQRKQENVTRKLIVIEHDNRCDKAYGHAHGESYREQYPRPRGPACR